jgi:hypothetical protein
MFVEVAMEDARQLFLRVLVGSFAVAKRLKGEAPTGVQRSEKPAGLFQVRFEVMHGAPPRLRRVAPAVCLDEGQKFAFLVANRAPVFDVGWPAALPPLPLKPGNTQAKDWRSLSLTKERVVHGTVVA